MSNEYPIGTLYQMAEIPEEALPRFLAELPDILASVRIMQANMRTFNASFEGSVEMKPEEPSWVDDDLGEVTVSVRIGDDDNVMSSTAKMRGH